MKGAGVQCFKLVFVVYENDDLINLPPALERVDRKNQQFFDIMNVLNRRNGHVAVYIVLGPRCAGFFIYIWQMYLRIAFILLRAHSNFALPSGCGICAARCHSNRAATRASRWGTHQRRRESPGGTQCGTGAYYVSAEMCHRALYLIAQPAMMK